VKTWKASRDPEYAAKKARVEHLYAIAGRDVAPGARRAGGDLLRGWVRAAEPAATARAAVGGGQREGQGAGPGAAAADARDLYPDRGGRHLFAAYELGQDKLSGHVKPRKTRARFLEFCRYLRSLYPPSIRIAIICDNFSPHLTTRRDGRVGAWATASNVEIAYTPANSSWLNRVEAQFTALRYFALDGTDHASHKEQASMIRRYIIWRNNHAYDERLRRIVDRANVA
jgi:transposase